MSFRWFIYYCGMGGGCAAFIGWAFGKLTPSRDEELQAGLKGLLLGLIVSLILSLLDSLWNGGGSARVMRVLSAVLVGALGGFLGGWVGQWLFSWFQKHDWSASVAPVGLVMGWIITGLLIGASVGLFDLVERKRRGQASQGARRKLQHGLLGGGLGGLLGGILFALLSLGQKPYLWTPSAAGFVVLGIMIGLMVGLAQVILKEAWLKVEEGFRAGRELILSRPEITIGRAERCDLGLFGDPRVEKMHARIVQQNGRYVLEDSGTPNGTFVNGQRIDRPTPLRSGDLIRVGRNILRFSERQKHPTS